METPVKDNQSETGTLLEPSSSQDPVAKIHPFRRKRNRSPYPPSDLRHWESRVYLPTNSRGATSNSYVIQLGSEYRRTTFALHSADRRTAARLAQRIWEHLKANGWQSTLETFKPQARRPESVTVGQYLELVSKLTEVKPATWTANVRMLRMILSTAFGIEPPQQKYGWRAGADSERARWLKRVNNIPLERISPERLAKWRTAFLQRVGSDQLALKRARISCASIARQASSLFADKLLNVIKPSGMQRNPFADLPSIRRPSQRYRSEINFERLIQRAFKELRKDVEVLKAFLLLAFGGLRRSEADALEWNAFDFGKGLIRIRTTEHFAGKNETSLSDVYLDREVLELFRAWKKNASGSFVLESEAQPKADASFHYYRASDTFARLLSWLRLAGVTGPKPIHILRKEYGSELSRRHGILTASHALRHASISLTREHYVDARSSATLGLGKLLRPTRKGSGKEKKKPRGRTSAAGKAKRRNSRTATRRRLKGTSK